MAARGYCTADEVVLWLGADLVGIQAAQVAAWQEAAEQAIDDATGQPFATGAIVDERYPAEGPYLYLRSVPLADAAVTVKGYRRGSTEATVLTVTAQYEVDDLATGRLYLPAWTCADYYRISYTPVATVPAAIGQATAALLAEWVTNGGPGGATGAVTRERVGDVEVQYASAPAAAAAAALPARVLQLLGAYRPAVAFA